MDSVYNVFKTEELQVILDHLASTDLGVRVFSSLYDQHFEIGPQLIVESEPAEVQDILEKELAWSFFKYHGADHNSLKGEIERIMGLLGTTDQNKAISAYASQVYRRAITRARIGMSL